MPTLYPCAACQRPDQLDNHPKVHYGETRYHYDCLPAVVKDDIFRGEVQTARQQGLAQVVAHAEGAGREHLHGADLRNKYVEIMTPINEAELAAHLAAMTEVDSNG